MCHFLIENSAERQKAQPALGSKKAPVSALNWFNKTYNEANRSKHTYWFAQI